jgi:DNA-binding XRE family transcriptional regulator
MLAIITPKRVSVCQHLDNSRPEGRCDLDAQMAVVLVQREKNMFTGAQCRAARGLVDWTRDELAKAAKVSPETVKNIEHGVFRPQEETAQKIIKTFEIQGVEFTDSEGVRFHKDTVMRLEGIEGFKQFLDDVYKEAQQPYSHKGGEKPIYISSVDDRLFVKILGEWFAAHVRRMNDIKDMSMRILIQEKPFSLIAEENRGKSYREYRKLEAATDGNVPFYVYGDKLAILVFEGDDPPQILILTSTLASKAYREQFEVIWKQAKPLEKPKH